MHAMNGLTHQEVVTLKRRLELEEKVVRDAMHEEFTRRSADRSGEESVQYHETTDDEAIVDALNDAEVVSVTRHADSLRAIERSLKAIAEEKYGACETCARHIGVKRMTANPTATRCMPCQNKHERGQMHTSL
jgi:RNA polymerase-binding transcription factor DksA